MADGVETSDMDVWKSFSSKKTSRSPALPTPYYHEAARP
jgi:hypothetical protein